MILNERIQSWGVPEYYKDKNIKYSFNRPGDFCLVDVENKKRFEMKIISIENSNRIFPQKEDELNLIYIHVVDPQDRKKGIASYYLKKLVDYCKELNITTISLSVGNMPDENNPYVDVLVGNHLKKDDLKNFYKKHLGIEMKLEM